MSSQDLGFDSEMAQDALEDLPIDYVIKSMEKRAYALARNGSFETANSLFIAVAALERYKSAA
ncbi:hypothetical protein SLH49_19965 [Cognatiyoonia sp. IB215446]|uniref:hypothetical protein n=1 Tax=Cognatiyoonia sp. IB215446 TaxID=3097355 RepID=UPI002A0D30E0|nr:hypothetical protein [Cognatiyoonia sp. IB215446]MDX8350274.1 hypothetical protein [Cognatiyoonia sp. IB215446]